MYTERAFRAARLLARPRCIGRNGISFLDLPTTQRAFSSLSSSASPSVTERMQHEAEQNFARLCQHYDQNESTTGGPRLLTSPEATAQYLVDHDIRSVLFDCDGVVYRSPDPAPGAAACLHALLDSGKRVCFVTNNSAVNPGQLRSKLTRILGLQDDVLTQDMMISSAFTAAQYLKQNLIDVRNDTVDSSSTTLHKPPPRVYVIGSDGLRQEIRDTGFEVVRAGGEEEKLSMSREELAAYDFDALGPVDAVVVGHDTDFGYRKLCIANVLLQRNPHALLLGTSLDAFDLVGADGRHLPGNGSLVRALEYCAGREAVDCGKPSPVLASVLDAALGLDCRKTLFVGDRLDTDIRFALESGMHAALVLTGVTTVEKLQSLGSGTTHEPLPTVIVPHVGYFAG